MSRHSRVFTPTAIELIRELFAQGKSASEIADVIGSTPASVRARCCQLKIKIPGRGRPGLLRTQPHHIGEPKLVVHMPPAAYAALKQKAAHMQKSADKLAGMLLEAIIGADLYEAVLDDGD
jgi:hypothetical protein